MAYLLGIDNGGTLVKAVLFDLNGNEMACSRAELLVDAPKAQHCQRDMELLWEKNVQVIRDVMAAAGVKAEEVRGVSFSGHGKGLYLWGHDNKPAYPGILSTDSRAHEWVDKWNQNGTGQTLYGMAYQQLMACQPACLLKWIQQEAPDVLRNTKWVFSVQDYVRFRLTGVPRAEITGASGTNLVNLDTQRFDKRILELLGLEEVYEKLPALADSTELCGVVTEEAAALTGLAAGTPCAAGLFDIDACAIAMNTTCSDTLAVIAGTWSINEYISNEPVADGTVMMNSLYCMPGYYLIEESSPTSAANHNWFIHHFMGEEKVTCKIENENIYRLTDKMVEEIPPEKEKIVFLPYLFGANYDPKGKLTLVGLDSHHTKADIMRAIFEGVAFCHKVHVQKLLLHNPLPRAIRLAGGVARSAVWAQIFADVLELPVELVQVEELGALGAAMAAGVAAGVYPSLQSAASRLEKPARVLFPNPDNQLIYREKFQLYLDVSQAMSHFWTRF